MWSPDRGTLRAAGFVALLVTVFLTVNTSVAYAANSASAQGGLLSPLELDTSEGVSLKGYELGAQGGSIFSFTSNWQALILSGLFTVVRVFVGLACWAIEVAYRFPLLKLLTKPAQHLSDVYTETVVDDLGLKSMLLAWAFVFGLVLLVRGKHAKGIGEIALTLVIGALAASVFVTPNFLLGKDGPILQTQSAAADIAEKTVNAHSWGGKISSDDPCATVSGPAYQTCYDAQDAKTPEARKIAKPIQDAVTNSLVVKPFMLLEYGRILDPSNPADRKAYQVHLMWVSGAYKPKPWERAQSSDKDDICKKIKGPGRKYCERREGDDAIPPHSDLPSLTVGEQLLDATTSPVVSQEDQEFAAFLGDLRKAGPVGKECADYARQPTWWRVASVVMVLIAALLICALLLSAAMVLVGITAVCAGAAASGGVCFVWGMLPGPSRSAVWKWLALFGISMAAILAISTFIPAVGITIDVILTNGPDLLAERLLLIDVVAIVGLAFHRRLLMVITSFSQRLTLRMRYAKIGGSHMAGDSQLGAALAMSGVGGGGYLAAGSLRGRGRTGLSTAGLVQGVLGGFTDGAGMPGEPARLLADANAEASRGLAPIGAAVVGARLAAGGAFSLLVAKKPDEATFAKLRKPTAEGDDPNAAQNGGGQKQAGSGRLGGGPKDRYRDDDGTVIDPDTGEVLHDQKADRTLLSTRAHNRLVRLRGYRLAHRGGRFAYASTMGLPTTVRTAQAGASRVTHDTRQQLRVWGNTVRQDRRGWASSAQSAKNLISRAGVQSASASSRRLPPPAASASAARGMLQPTGGSTPPASSGASGSGWQPGSPRPAAWPMAGPRPGTGPGAAGAGQGSGAQPSAGPRSAAPSATPPAHSPATRPPATPPPAASAPAAPSGGSGSLPPSTQSRPRLSGGAGSSNASRQAAQEMFRRIQERNAQNPRPPADDSDDEEGDNS
ncbi:hypothetical protein OHB53_09235 [Streptomyces sp. NBC_00056]|uniref:hypothetical protein n=1 Tax=Streptomyces sp. NBC_00056 TaxID=2975633 RepID=UPI0032512416